MVLRDKEGRYKNAYLNRTIDARVVWRGKLTSGHVGHWKAFYIVGVR